MIQILLHFLLLTLPDVPQDEPMPHATDITAPSPSPRKRKRVRSTDGDIVSAAALEERLELLMDRLAMWQLMGSIDLNAGGDERVRQSHRLTALHKGRQKTTDDRDWMQVFCEDIIEPLCVGFVVLETIHWADCSIASDTNCRHNVLFSAVKFFKRLCSMRTTIPSIWIFLQLPHAQILRCRRRLNLGPMWEVVIFHGRDPCPSHLRKNAFESVRNP
jgi:hypothetical protein